MEHPVIYLLLPFALSAQTLQKWSHVFLAITVTLILTLLSFTATRRLEMIPKGKQNVFELMISMLLDFMGDVMGHEARRFFPLVGSLAFFILTSNLLGLIPGFDSPTGNLNTTASCALVVFFSTHYYGVKKHGIKYVKHFTGPIWWLSPLIMPIEIISHLVRPVSLSIRLFGNIFGGHLVLGSFAALVPLLVPLPMMVMEIFVAFVQTIVFIMLSMIYISLSVEEAH